MHKMNLGISGVKFQYSVCKSVHESGFNIIIEPFILYSAFAKQTKAFQE